MTDTRPPHPGPPPPVVVFPFAEAADAIREIDELLEDLRSVSTTHVDARNAIRSFEGDTGDRFRTGFAERMDELDGVRTRLRSQHDDIADDLAEAQRRQERYDVAYQQWHRAMRARANWRPPVTAS